MAGFNPKNLGELWEVLEKNSDSLIVSGATDTAVWFERDQIQPENIVYIGNIIGLKEISESDGFLRIGSCCTMTEIAENPLVQKSAQLLSKCARSVGAYQIRNMATIGGNIANSSPAGDTLPALYAMDAVLVIQNRNEVREVSIHNMISGPRKNILRKKEIISEIKIPLFDNYQCYFEKIGSRGANAISKASLAILIKKNQNIYEDVRIAMGAVGPVILRAKSLEDKIRGNSVTQSFNSEIEIFMLEQVKPIDDIRSTEEYRRDVLKDFLKEIFQV